MSRRLSCLLIAAVAAAHAAVFIAYQRPDWDTQWTDQNGYLLLGRVLADTGRFTRFANTTRYVPEAIRTPVYPAFVAGLDLAFGESHLVIALAQAALLVLICLFVYAIARTIASDCVATAAGLVTALYPPLPYFGALVLTETLATFLVTAGMVLWLRALGQSGGERKGPVGPFLLSGPVFALATLTRPAFQFLPLFLIGAGVIATRDARRLRWRGGLIMLAAFFAAVVPWLAYNAAYFKTVTFSPAGGPGRQLFEGSWQVQLSGRIETELTTIADSTPDPTALDERVRAVAARSRLPAEPMLRYVHQHQDIRRIWTEPTDPWERTTARIAADREYLRVGLENAWQNPVRHIWRRAVRGTLLLWAAEIPVRYSDINRLSPVTIRAIWLPQVALMLLATWGIVVLARSRARDEAWAIAALLLYVTAVHTPFYAEARYSLPAKPMILLLATVAVADLVGRFRHPSEITDKL